MLRKTARETALLLHPNSAMRGLNATPMVNRAPELKKRTKKEAARTYHP
jgi:hypothetical protein